MTPPQSASPTTTFLQKVTGDTALTNMAITGGLSLMRSLTPTDRKILLGIIAAAVLIWAFTPTKS